MEVSPFIRALPKAELHLHLEGSVDSQTLAELSRRHNTPFTSEHNRYTPDPNSGTVLTEDVVGRLYRFKDFMGFLMAFKAVTERLRTPEDFELITYRLARNLHAENVMHAEVFVSVGVIHWRGQEFAPFFAGLERGRKRAERDFGISLLWIFDAVRHFGVDEAHKVVETAVQLRDRQLRVEDESSIVGFGIGGDERRGPAKDFHPVYHMAQRSGLRLTAHAGETMGPESVWAAVNLGAERIGHGLRAIEDDELMEFLVEKQVPVEVCITSNLKTGCIQKLEDHPVKKMFDAGVMVTLNTDDPTMFHTTLNREFQIAQGLFGFSNDQLQELARNSFEASFLPAEKKISFLAKVDALP